MMCSEGCFILYPRFQSPSFYLIDIITLQHGSPSFLLVIQTLLPLNTSNPSSPESKTTFYVYYVFLKIKIKIQSRRIEKTKHAWLDLSRQEAWWAASGNEYFYSTPNWVGYLRENQYELEWKEQANSLNYGLERKSIPLSLLSP